jgi:hypothetical protein
MFVAFSDEPTDRRRDARKEISRSAMLDFGRMVPKRPCTIKDISEGGARLHVGLLIDLPNRFSLLVSPARTVRRECQLVWASEFEVGIKFVYW